MTDEKKSRPKRLDVMSVNTEDFIRFLNAKAGEDDPCPVCHFEHWATLNNYDDEQGDTAFRIGSLVRNREKQFYLSTFAYYCLSCGYVRHHMAKIVHRWVMQHPENLSDELIDEPTSDDNNDSGTIGDKDV